MSRGRLQLKDMTGHKSWESLLADRLPLSPLPNLKERHDTRRAEERAQKRQRNDPEGLDPQQETLVALSYFLRRWVGKGSWAVCTTCSATHRVFMQMPNLTSLEKWPNTTRNCIFCRSHYYVPDHDDFPLPLRGLSREVVHALRPFHLYIGDHQQGKGGFRRHSRLADIRCAPVDVTTKIDALPNESKQIARTAFHYLMTYCDTSAYGDFVREHRAILAHGQQDRMLSAGFLLRRYIECSLWPHLYPTRASCDTAVAGRETQYKSVKMAYIAKVMSPVLDYAIEFELLHFHFDRHVLSHFSSVTKSANINLQRALKNFPDSPHDLLLNARALEDLNKQFGPAKFLITLSPGAYVTTWPEVCQNVRDVTGIRTLGDNAYEALHIVHVLDQLCRCFLFNTSNCHRRVPVAWSMFDTVDQQTSVLAWAYRVEFQEGSRKHLPGAATKHYHGTGMPHVHIVFWCSEAIKDTRVLNWLRADLATDFPRLHAAVLRIQSLEKPEPTRLPLSEETYWDGSTPVLRHSREDEAAGILPYLSPLCLSELCHSNVSFISHPGQVSEYMTKVARYVTKNNQALDHNWLRDEKSGFKAALQFLIATQPSTAQMLNLLSNGSTFYMSCNRKDVSVPAPDENGDSTAVQLFRAYLEDAVSQTIPYDEFLRTYNTNATPPRKYQRLRAGTVALACETTSPWRDHYYAQWLTLNHIWRGTVELPADRNLAPPHHVWFATCLLMVPSFWEDDAAVVHWLSMAALSKPRMLTLLSAIRCWRSYVLRFLQGEVIYAEPQMIQEPRDDLNAEQQGAMERICSAYGAMRDSDTNTAIRIRGEAGTGKSRVLNDVCWMASLPEMSPLRHHAFSAKNVLLVTPTGILSDAYRRSWATSDNISVDTFDGAYDTLQRCAETPFHLSQFDIWIVDECEFLTSAQWDRLRVLWGLCTPVLIILAGDPSQLSPVGGGDERSEGHIPVQEVVLRTQMRFDPLSPWGKACRALRGRKPTDNELNVLVGGRVLSATEPTVDGMHIFHDVYPQGLSVSITIRGAQRLNELAVEALLPPSLHLGDIVVECNGDTRRIPVHSSGRLMVTRNLNKELGIVNGAFGHVVHFTRDCVVLRLDTGLEAAIHKVAYETGDGQYFVAYPLELGYACTLAKVQGYTLDKGVAVFPDVGVPGGGYVAVTRVRSEDKLFWHTTPAKQFFIPSRPRWARLRRQSTQ